MIKGVTLNFYKAATFFLISVGFTQLFIANFSYADATVQLIGHAFSPNVVTVNEGDTVTWEAKSGGHNIISGNVVAYTPIENNIFRSNDNDGRLPIDGTYSFTFTRDVLNEHASLHEIFNYFCFPHAAMGMTGVVKSKSDCEIIYRYPCELAGDGWIQCHRCDTVHTDG